MMKVAELIPASSAGESSSISMAKPRRSAHRRYIRSIISAQSAASVPPAPGGVDLEVAAGVLQAAPQVGQFRGKVTHGESLRSAVSSPQRADEATRLSAADDPAFGAEHAEQLPDIALVARVDMRDSRPGRDEGDGGIHDVFRAGPSAELAG